MDGQQGTTRDVAALIDDALTPLAEQLPSNVYAAEERIEVICADDTLGHLFDKLTDAIPDDIDNALEAVVRRRAATLNPSAGHLQPPEGFKDVTQAEAHRAAILALVLPAGPFLIGLMTAGEWAVGWYLAATVALIPSIVFNQIGRNWDAIALTDYRDRWIHYSVHYLEAQLADETNLDADTREYRQRVLDTFHT